MKRRPPSLSALALHALDEAYGKAAWHGVNLRGSLRGVTALEASRRPDAARHNIREIVLHAAYWKYRVRRRLTGEPRGSFSLPGNDWFRREGSNEKEWRAERDLLDREHRALRRAVAAFPESRYQGRLPGDEKRTAQREIAGIALHDVYHAGQIQLLKLLSRKGRSR
jgi:uncharacterized damage-inducible protein DinB